MVFELPGNKYTSNTLMQWGIILTSIDAIAHNFKNYRTQIALDEIFVGPERPQEQARYPAVVVHTSGMTFKSEGINGFQIVEPHQSGKLFYFSEGRLRLEVIGQNQQELWTISDFLTNQMLGGLVYGHSFYNATAQDTEGIALRFRPGQVDWGPLQWVAQPWNPSATDQMASASCEIPFHGEHTYYFDFKNISRIAVEASPVPTVHGAWLSVNTRV